MQKNSSVKTQSRVTRWRATAGMGAFGLAASAALVLAPDAMAAGTLTVSPATGLASSANVTVSGSGFTPNAKLYVAECDTTVSLGTACKQSSYLVVSVNGSGSFGPVTLPVTKTFTGWNGATGNSGGTVNCKGTGATDHQCGVQTSNTAHGVDDIATANIRFS